MITFTEPCSMPRFPGVTLCGATEEGYECALRQHHYGQHLDPERGALWPNLEYCEAHTEQFVWHGNPIMLPCVRPHGHSGLHTANVQWRNEEAS